MNINETKARIFSGMAPNLYWSALTGSRFPPRSTLRPDQKHHVVVTGLGARPFHPGKVDAWNFFPPFCARLAEHAIGVKFVARVSDVLRLQSDRTTFVHVCNETGELDQVLSVLPEMPGVRSFNDPRIGALIADKTRTNEVLSSKGVLMPSMVTEATDRVFSNENDGAGTTVTVVAPGEQLDPDRYNTEFIDSRVTFRDKEFYTTVRLLCVGRKVIHAFCRARPTTDGSPSVHAADTPLDAELIEHLQRVLVHPFKTRFEKIATDLNRILGAGFYAHDLVTCAKTKDVYLIETNHKFDGSGYARHLRPIASDLPSHKILYTDEFACRSADLFAEELDAIAS